VGIFLAAAGLAVTGLPAAGVAMLPVRDGGDVDMAVPAPEIAVRRAVVATRIDRERTGLSGAAKRKPGEAVTAETTFFIGGRRWQRRREYARDDDRSDE
jgi:hypothetical protein